MTLPLSDMNRDALVRELRIAVARGDIARAAKVRYELAKRNKPKHEEYTASTTRHWWERD